jgi:hypothetical protein
MTFPSASYSFPVTQAINPWSWFNNSLAQAGFININVAGSGNPRLEQDITQNVASYGRQLGVLMDVVDVLLPLLNEKTLTASQQKVLAQYHTLTASVALQKIQHGVGVEAETARSLLKRFTTLEASPMTDALKEKLQKLVA